MKVKNGLTDRRTPGQPYRLMPSAAIGSGSIKRRRNKFAHRSQLQLQRGDKCHRSCRRSVRFIFIVNTAISTVLLELVWYTAGMQSRPRAVCETDKIMSWYFPALCHSRHTVVYFAVKAERVQRKKYAAKTYTTRYDTRMCSIPCRQNISGVSSA